MPPVIAIDAMGGDRAPAEIIAGALQAVDACDVDVLLVGTPEALRDQTRDIIGLAIHALSPGETLT